MSNTPICPCGGLAVPLTISNPPGRNSISYRVGDYISFREALLRPRPGETELTNWRPSASGDLAVQMVEWWAYLADILTFYNERIANEDYLRTAELPESVKRLILVLGYRPRPGIGATGTLAALLSSPKPITLPQGFQVQSKPGPGKQPQIFELGAATLVQPPDVVAADPVPGAALLGADGSSVLLQGTVSSIKAGDQLLLLHNGWVGVDQSNNPDKNFMLVTVASVNPEKDPHGKTNTRVVFTAMLIFPTTPKVSDYTLLRSTQTAHLWPFSGSKATVITNRRADLESITRQIKVGDPVLFSAPDPSLGEQLVSVTAYQEPVWYANGDPSDPSQPPTSNTPPPIPIPHTAIGFQPFLNGNWNRSQQTVSVRYAWQQVGTLIPTPITSFSGAGNGLQAVPPAVFPQGNGIPVLIEDGNGNGEAAQGSGSPNVLDLSNLPDPPVNLVPPLNVLFNLLSVSRGKTVSNEILGSGDATVAGQEFVLKNSPLTYLMSGSSTSGAGYTSTLQVWVDGVQWKEAPSFYGQPANAHIFVTREDENNQTHVQFGDGINGARLSSGTNNVVATYRYGSGADSPDAGSLTVILQPQPGLKSIVNPVPVGGGADPDPPDQIRKYAPQSVLNFGRAVSGDDYETIAAQAPGVARAKSYWGWDPLQQRTVVTVYVGDDQNAVAAAQLALSNADDPNRPVVVNLATVVPVSLSFTLLVDPNYVATDVQAAVTSALIDPNNGLLGANVIGIGQVIFESQIYEACLSVPGAVAVHALSFSVFTELLLFRQTGSLTRFLPVQRFFQQPQAAPFRFDPGTGGFFQLPSSNLTISTEVAANG
jgi:Baseplate J-like protein